MESPNVMANWTTETLPDVQSARLPQMYSSAKVALSECYRIDECKDWADKMAALASYAKQSEDNELENIAIRIRGRASRRVGELLKEITPSVGGRPRKKPISSAAPVSRTRTQVAKESGLSKRQKVTALRIASIPAEEFEKQIESETPPTVTKLAEQGTVKRKSPRETISLEGIDPEVFKLWMPIGAELNEIETLIKKTDIAQAVKGATRKERRKALEQLYRVQLWLDDLRSLLEQREREMQNAG